MASSAVSSPVLSHHFCCGFYIHLLFSDHVHATPDIRPDLHHLTGTFDSKSTELPISQLPVPNCRPSSCNSQHHAKDEGSQRGQHCSTYQDFLPKITLSRPHSKICSIGTEAKPIGHVTKSDSLEKRLLTVFQSFDAVMKNAVSLCIEGCRRLVLFDQCRNLAAGSAFRKKSIKFCDIMPDVSLAVARRSRILAYISGPQSYPDRVASVLFRNHRRGRFPFHNASHYRH